MAGEIKKRVNGRKIEMIQGKMRWWKELKSDSMAGRLESLMSCHSRKYFERHR